MANNAYFWNTRLKFSWGHIIAFLALIFISYVVYMGTFYSTGGDFLLAIAVVAVVDILLLVTFIGAQQMKAVDSKFKRSIWIERVLLILSLIAFVAAMLPYNHFWSVYSHKNEIEKKFKDAIKESKNMFSEYDEYANNRIESYDIHLDEIYPNYNISKENYAYTLRLQLQSPTIEKLEKSAIKWIDESNKGVSVWNAFLVGNVEVISSAIESWEKELLEASELKMSNEPDSVQTFSSAEKSFNIANNDFKELQKIYTNKGGFSFISLITAIVLFLMLIFPYYLQSRNTKAQGYYHLIPRKNKEKSTDSDDPYSGELDISNEEYSRSSDDDDIYSGPL